MSMRDPDPDMTPGGVEYTDYRGEIARLRDALERILAGDETDVDEGYRCHRIARAALRDV
jgi:hypothetical protein